MVEMSNARGFSYKVGGGKFNGDVRGRFFFTQRVVGAWNALPRVEI